MIRVECFTNANKQAPVRAALAEVITTSSSALTRIGITLSTRSRIVAVILSLNGGEVARLVDEVREAGSYLVVWNSERIKRGTYLCLVTANGMLLTKRVLML